VSGYSAPMSAPPEQLQLRTAPSTSSGGDDEYDSLYDNLYEPAALPSKGHSFMLPHHSGGPPRPHLSQLGMGDSPALQSVHMGAMPGSGPLQRQLSLGSSGNPMLQAQFSGSAPALLSMGSGGLHPMHSGGMGGSGPSDAYQSMGLGGGAALGSLPGLGLDEPMGSGSEHALQPTAFASQGETFNCRVGLLWRL
jgi:hypothetical protein